MSKDCSLDLRERVLKYLEKNEDKQSASELFLPPYSPDLNPIEKCRANIKAKVRELLPKMKTFIEALDTAILSM